MKRRLIIALIIISVLSILADFLIHHEPGHGGLMGFNMPGLYAIFGFIGCVAIILVSKYIGHHWLQRKEDYYDRKDDDA